MQNNEKIKGDVNQKIQSKWMKWKNAYSFKEKVGIAHIIKKMIECH